MIASRRVLVLVLSVCVFSPNVVPQTRDAALQAIRDIKALADWKMSAPTYLYDVVQTPAMRCNIGDMDDYTADRLDYEVPLTVDNQTANKDVETLDKRVVQYLHKAGWSRMSSKGLADGIPDLRRCYTLNGAIVQISKETGRCTMNTPCRVYDGFAVIVYGPRKPVCSE